MVHSVHACVPVQHLVLAEGRFLRSVLVNLGHGVTRRDVNIAGTEVAQRLRCCATNRNVAGSIPAGVIGIFH